MLLVQSGERRKVVIPTKKFSLFIGICHIPFLFFLFSRVFSTLSFIFDDFSELWVNTLFDNYQENVSLQPSGKLRLAGKRSRPSPRCITTMGKQVMRLSFHSSEASPLNQDVLTGPRYQNKYHGG